VTAQASLDGIAPPPPPPALPEHAPRIAIHGVLASDAVVRVGGKSGRVKLEALIFQQLEHHPHAVPIVATEICEDLGCFDSTHTAAVQRAAQLRAGDEIVALGRGIQTGLHAGAHVLRLIECDGIAANPQSFTSTNTRESSDHAH
jgi:hypothetical protein